MRSDHPSYWQVFLTFARNSLVRDMTFRSNFLIEMLTSLTWMLMNLGFYLLIFRVTPGIGAEWNREQFFVFLATTVIVNGIVQAFFMPNMDEFSELIRSGNLDFALLKPIDTQFLISLRKIEWSTLGNLGFALVLMAYSLWRLDYQPSALALLLYPLYVLCGVAILFSVMTVLASVSVWLGRNQSIYDFWFYVTNFSRYPMEIYEGAVGTPLQFIFTYLIPILVVVNVPARLLARPLESDQLPLALFALAAASLSLIGSRWLFNRALLSYRSASS